MVIRQALGLAALVACTMAAHAAGTETIDVTAGALTVCLNRTSGTFKLAVGGADWFEGGLAVLRDGATWYSSAPSMASSSTSTPARQELLSR